MVPKRTAQHHLQEAFVFVCTDQKIGTWGMVRGKRTRTIGTRTPIPAALVLARWTVPSRVAVVREICCLLDMLVVLDVVDVVAVGAVGAVVDVVGG